MQEQVTARRKIFAPATGEGVVLELRARRSAVGLSLTKFARCVHVATSTASRWEAGRRRPHLADIPRIAAALECDPREVQSWFRAGSVLSSETAPGARNLRVLREQQQLSRAHVATALGISTATVAHWECDRRRLPVRRVPALALVLEMSPARLLAALAAPVPVERPAPLLGQLRSRTGFTQKAVAAAIGVSYGTVSAWERGRRAPTWPQLRELERLYRCPLRDIARAVGKPPLLLPSWSSVDRAELGRVLQDVRQWRGESIRQVAGEIEVDWTTLRRWERGESRPSARYLPGLERVLGMPRGSLPR